MNIENLVTILQSSIAPFVLVSGISLLVLSMTNRLGRPIDRIRMLCKELKTKNKKEKIIIKKQIHRLYKRCRILKNGIKFAMLSIIYCSLNIFVLFLSFVFEFNAEIIVQMLFIGTLLFLFIALGFYMKDIHYSLNSLNLEINHAIKKYK